MVGVGYLIFLLVMAIIFYKKHKLFQRYGYLGIFLTALISNLSMFSPATMIAVVLGGRIFNPLFVGFIAGLGCILGEIIAYDVGSSGTTMLQDKEWFNKIQVYMEKNGFLTIYVVTSIPQPVANISALVAGATKFPFFEFVTASFLGNWTQHTLTALFGKFTKRVI